MRFLISLLYTVVCALGCALVAGISQAQVPATLPKPDVALTTAGPVLSIAAQPDGGVVLTGGFTAVNGIPRKGLARLLPDGTLDPQWAPQASWPDDPMPAWREVFSLPDGSVLLRSDAGSIDGQPYTLCGVRFAPGTPATFTLDWHLQAACPDEIAIDDEGWYYRSAVGGYSMWRGRWETGVRDPDWNGDSSLRPSRMVYDGNGGLIVQSNGGLVRVFTSTGAIDTSWQAPVGPWGQVATELVVDRAAGALYVGYFSGATVKLSLTTGQPFSGWSPGSWQWELHAMLLDADGNLLLGGNRGLLKLSGTTGALLNSWAADGIYGYVFDLERLGDGRVLVAGGFARLGQVPALGLASLAPSATQLVPVASVERAGSAEALAVQPGGGTIVAGKFERAGSAERVRLLRLLPDGGLDPNWAPVIDGVIRSVATDTAGDVYIAGYFDHVNGEDRFSAAKLDGLTGAVDAGWDPDPPERLVDIVVDAADRVYLVPDVTSDAAAYRVLPDGSGVDQAWSPGPADHYGSGALVTENHLYVRVADSQYDFRYIRRIALDTGQLDASWFVPLRRVNRATSSHADMHPSGFQTWPADSGLTAPLHAKNWAIPRARMIQIADGDLVIAGQFTTVAGVARNGIARVSTTTPPQVRDWNPQVDGGVYEVASSTDGRLFAVGDFTTVGGEPRNGIAEIDMQDGSAIDTWIPPTNGGCLAVNNDRLIIGDTWRHGGLYAYPLDIGDTIFATHFN
ncbi:MAG: hypothetical protein AMXMBFR59_16240 [Rhodanobacteraceae bacterium]